MSTAPKIGDLVTVALRARHGDDLMSRTKIIHITPFFSGLPTASSGFMANDDDRNVHYLIDEGITWVRGHVADDSPEGKALIAAHALAPKLDPFTAVGTMPVTGALWMPIGGSDAHATVGVGTLVAAKPNPKNELGE